jgi:cytochrome c-type biogenesis protein CcmE
MHFFDRYAGSGQERKCGRSPAFGAPGPPDEIVDETGLVVDMRLRAGRALRRDRWSRFVVGAGHNETGERMSTAKNQKWVYLAAVLLVAAGVGYLVFSGLSQNSVYFLNVAEALAMPAEKVGQARLFGTVSADEIVPDPAAMGVDFTVLDKDDPTKSIRVKYRGTVPDTFKPGVEVILEGSFKSGASHFEATTLLTKCPSKYEKNEKGQMRPPGYKG